METAPDDPQTVSDGVMPQPVLVAARACPQERRFSFFTKADFSPGSKVH
jgi:hypothetical protein